MTQAPQIDPAASLARLVRDEGRAVLATLTRQFGDLGRAEDAVQDASVQALIRWPADGVPPNPRAWLITAARHRALDQVRRETKRAGKEDEAVRMAERAPEVPTDSMVRDDLLRLVFTCCHPALSTDAQIALSLRTLCRLTTAEAARALVVSEATMTKRLTRARRKIAVAHIPYRVPPDHELPDRLAAVAATVYLVFNEGYAATGGTDHLRVDRAEEAIRLARLLVDLLPGEASLEGLLALMLLQHARRDSRTGPGAVIVLLADQDRSQWDRAAIAEGVALVGEGLRRTPDRADPYVVQAAIASCHCLATSWEATDWNAIVSWYDVLLDVAPSPVVALNRAAALAERDGPDVALALTNRIDGLGAYPWWHATRAELLVRTGQPEAARQAYDAALDLELSDPVRAHLTERLDAVSSG